jgi:SAM-dependent methyltransferase
MAERFHLGKDSLVVEVASNDGYLLQYFVEQGIPVLGIEPAANIATVAESRGVPTLVKFFGAELARELAVEGKQADLIAGNNVLAQVPDLNSFVAGLKILLKPGGVVTLEFPHLLRTMEHNEFDQVYHEHFSYFSFTTVTRILGAHGLAVFDVQELPTHGGSLRVFARHAEDESKPVLASVPELAAQEYAAGLASLGPYQAFAEKAKRTKWRLVEMLLEAKREGKSVAGYGAPGKGTTLLVFCGIGKDLIEYTVDRNTYKHGRFMPGTHIPIYPPDRIRETRPDYVVILPWNLKDEIMSQMAYIREWGGRFIVPIPEPVIYG